MPKLKIIVHNLELALVYCLLGKLALLLAVPPNYAPPIFPSAGIALAMLLVSNYRLWPGIALGALGLMLWQAFGLSGAVTRDALLAAAITATGATLQAMLGAVLIKRFVGYPNALDHLREMGLFLLLGGPVSCLVGATTGIAGLGIAGVIETGHYFSNGWAWWAGDSLGVLVMAPLTLIAMGQPHEYWRSRTLSVGVPLLLAGSLATAVPVYMSVWEQRPVQAWWLCTGLYLCTVALGMFLLLLTGQAARVNRLVAQRNDELQRAYESLQITEQQLRRLFDEREKLQLDLHDDLLQTIYAARLGLENIKQIIHRHSDNVDSLLSEVLQSLGAVMNRVRHYTKTPIPSRNLVGRFRTTLRSLIPVGDDNAPELMIDIQSDVAEGLSEVQAEYLLRIAQEAVSNSLRHANAEAIRVLLWKEPGNLVLSIKDDGQGFDVNQQKTAAAGQGLKNLAIRAVIIGGCLSLRSRCGEGTEVTIDLRINNPC